MIKLDIEDYCEQCVSFVADVTPPDRVRTPNDDFTLSDTIVRCAYRKRCANIKRYLEQQMKGDVNKQ